MKVDRIRLIVDGATLFIGVLIAVAFGLFASVYSFTPTELAAAGVVAGGAAKLLLAYVVSLPPPERPLATSDLQELLNGLAKTSELGQVLNLLSGTQKSQYDAVMAKLNSMVRPIVLDPAIVPPAPAAPAEAEQNVAPA